MLITTADYSVSSQHRVPVHLGGAPLPATYIERGAELCMSMLVVPGVYEDGISAPDLGASHHTLHTPVVLPLPRAGEVPFDMTTAAGRLAANMVDPVRMVTCGIPDAVHEAVAAGMLTHHGEHSVLLYVDRSLTAKDCLSRTCAHLNSVLQTIESQLDYLVVAAPA